MDENRLQRAIAAIKRTRGKFDRLAGRASEIDTQLTELPEPPKLDRALVALLVLAVLVFGGLIGWLAWMG